MLKPHEIKLAEQAAEDLESPHRADQRDSSTRKDAQRALADTGARTSLSDGRWSSPLPRGEGQGEGQTGSLSEQLERLRKHLRQAHELVGRELYAICEARLTSGLTPMDKLTLQTALLRLANEIHDITQMIEQCQVSITFAKTP